LQVTYWILDHLLPPGLAVGFLVWMLRRHLSAYLGEKGKLRAQIEDIQRVARLTEEAKQEFVGAKGKAGGNEGRYRAYYTPNRIGENRTFECA